MSLGGGPEAQLTVYEHRPEHRCVLRLVVAAEGVVVNEHVTGPDRSDLLDEVAQHPRESVCHEREPLVLGEDSMVGVQDGRREITDLEKLRSGGALDDPGHVARGGLDFLPQHRHQDGIDHSRSPPAPSPR